MLRVLALVLLFAWPALGDADLRALVESAVARGERVVVVPPGTHRVEPPDAHGPHVHLRGLRDLTIDARGATLLLADPTRAGVVLEDCADVTVRGLVVRNGTVPFAQGTVERVDADRRAFEVRLHDGYPDALDDRARFAERTTWYAFDSATRRLKLGSHDYGNALATRVGPRRFRVAFDGPLHDVLAPGDLVATRGLGHSAVHLDRCARVTLDGVSVQYAGGFAFFETWGEGGHAYLGVQAKPGPRPDGAIEEPLLSGNADGLHSAAVAKGPTVERSTFARMPDDGIAIHGYYQLVRAARGATLTLAQPWPGVPYEAGDRIELVDATARPLGEATVRAARALPEAHLPPLDTPHPHFRGNRFFFELTLDRAVPGAREGAFASNLSHCGEGFALRDNYILDHRARGLLLKARGGVVERNFVAGSSIAACVFGPELWWGEAGHARDVRVAGNTFAHAGHATTGPWNRQAGALTVLGEPGPADARGHRALAIEGNAFFGNRGPNLVLDAAQDVRVRGNTFRAPLPGDNGGDWLGDARGALVFADRARGVRFDGNVAESAGAAVRHTPAAQLVNAAGVKIEPPQIAPAAPAFEYLDDGGVARRELRDPCVIKEGDTYYMTFTMWPFRNREEARLAEPNAGGSPGVRLFTSRDAVTWTPGPWLVKSSELPESAPYKHRFWAPELHKIGGRFYLIFTADNWLRSEFNPAGNWGTAGHCFVGVADRIEGPYRNVTWVEGGACDTTLAVGKDGATWAVMPKGDLFARQIDLSRIDEGVVRLVGEETKIVSRTSADSALARDSAYLEGPFVRRVGDRFALLYAAFFPEPADRARDEYWTGVAYADDLAGPWAKDPRGAVVMSGHVGAFDGPDGRAWLSTRVERPGDARRGELEFVPVEFDGQGRALVRER